MKKMFLMTALTAAMLASCSSSDDVTATAPPDGGTAAVQPVAVGFDAYTGRSVTRAGQAGDLTDTQLKYTKANGGGFGVFAYYTDLKKYDQTYVPNFMYNQGVFWKGENGDATDDVWVYSPVMYWPNEYGSNAQSDDEDKVSFFAYSPYVATESAAAGSVDGEASWGITGFSRNTTAGDPLVKYIASFNPDESVDLCWGVCADADKTWNRIQGSSQTIGAGLPWLDVEHPKGITDQKLKFTFKHALAKLNVQIDADVDVTEHDGTGEGALTASETKIYVRSISFTGIAMQGALNLNNSKANEALWLDYSGSTDLSYGQSVTVKDGRRDGREGAASADADNELPQGLNSAIVQDTGSTTSGVTTSLQNLFAGAALTTPVYVIPTGEDMTVTIVYDVETTNQDLPGYISDGSTHGLSVENRISKTISFGTPSGLVSGKLYTLKLHLGMNSVKFNAAVSDWDTPAVEEEAWLPETGEDNP